MIAFAPPVRLIAAGRPYHALPLPGKLSARPTCQRLRRGVRRIAGSIERDIARINASGTLAGKGPSGNHDTVASQLAERASVSALPRRRLSLGGTTR